jgi:hypothetical protein
MRRGQSLYQWHFFYIPNLYINNNNKITIILNDNWGGGEIEVYDCLHLYFFKLV